MKMKKNENNKKLLINKEINIIDKKLTTPNSIKTINENIYNINN